MTKIKKNVNIPLNRAEGDLEIYVDVVDGVIAEAWSSGTMYRGFENIMLGRGALDGLVVTPRICGICSLTHLNAAAEALDAICGVTPPDNARRLRNIALMVETIQSDVRQPILMFMSDFANQEAYKNHPLGKEAFERYAPLKGSASIEVIREVKKLIEIVGIIGGQWPHTSFMVPGGVTSIPDASKILQCRMILRHFQNWYERYILGCSVGRFQEVTSEAELDDWLYESKSHQESELGFFLRFAKEAGLDKIGQGTNRFLSYGNFTLPLETAVQGISGRLLAPGFAENTTVHPFHHEEIFEDHSHSWFEKQEDPLHPFQGTTKPYASGMGGELYSWVKAPRYSGRVVETGPLAEMVVGSHPLFHDLLQRGGGANAMIRELARIVRPVSLMTPMLVWLDELVKCWQDDFYRKVGAIPDGEGAGLIMAARGALGHWVKTKGEKITQYQVITPSSWNGSPRDSGGNRGAWEEALVGTPVRDISNPVEAGHVIRSFDPCLVCAVHTVKKRNNKT